MKKYGIISARKRAQNGKKACRWGGGMYKFPSKQMKLSDFGLPMGVTLSPDNRWVKKAELIPWEEIEIRYAALFKNRKGNVAKPLRLALGALIIQTERRLSDEETPLQIQETPCLQYFCGLPEYKDKLPFDPSLMVYFRKRLTPEILGEINELIIAKAEGKDESADDDDSDESEPPNSGSLIVDATCAPQDIRYPQDTSLLNEARENLEQMVDDLHDPKDGEKPRTYRRKAHRDYLKIAKKRNKTAKEIRKGAGKQLRYIRRDLEIIEEMLKSGKTLSDRQSERLKTIQALFEQQRYMFENRIHKVENRIVSLSQPWVRPIVRGKAKAKCEFGAKLDISVADGFVRLEHTSFEPYNESENLQAIIERYRAREGHYPEVVMADQIYRTRNNLMFCKAHGIRLSGKPLGRPKKDSSVDRKQIRADEIDRIEVERKFSYAKGSFGLGLIRTRLKETSETAIALSVLSLNLAHIGRILRALFRFIVFAFVFSKAEKKVAIIQ
ncbi:MAG: IS5 family transposase [Acutalibacteraceae bacterium]